MSHPFTFDTPKVGRKVITVMMWLFLGSLAFHAIEEIYTNYECNRDFFSPEAFCESFHSETEVCLFGQICG